MLGYLLHGDRDAYRARHEVRRMRTLGLTKAAEVLIAWTGHDTNASVRLSILIRLTRPAGLNLHCTRAGRQVACLGNPTEQSPMNYPLSFLSSIASIFALWIAFDAGYRPYRVSVLRSQLLQLRSELIEAAREGRFGAEGIEDTAYLGVRQELNGFMRYGRQFTIFRLLVLVWSSRWWLDSDYTEARWHSLAAAVANHPRSAKEELTRIMREAEYAIVFHMIDVNIVGFVCLRIWGCATRVLRIQRNLRDALVRVIDEHRALLVPIEEDATRVFAREERRGIA